MGFCAAARTRRHVSGSRWRDKPVVVRAPASSANLGPGFDALGLALSLHDVAVARVTDGGLDIEVSGEGSETAAAGEAHLVVRAMRAAFDVLGAHPPGVGLRCLNAIPHGRGLGSSASAIVTGSPAARALARAAPTCSPTTLLLALAAEPGGAYPDNVAACLLGGLTIAWTPVRRAGPGGPELPVTPVTPAGGPRAGAGGDPAGAFVADEARPRTRGGAAGHRAASRRGRQRRPLRAAGARSRGVPDVLFVATEDSPAPAVPGRSSRPHRGAGRGAPRRPACRGGLRGRARRCWRFVAVAPGRPDLAARYTPERVVGGGNPRPSTRPARALRPLAG